MHSVFWGATIAIAAAIASNLGVNVQKRSHNCEGLKSLAMQRPYTRRPMWWFGMALVIFGALADFVALGFAAQTLVASIGGGSTIFANVVFAHYWLKQELYITDIIGVALVTVGVITLACASSEGGHYTIDEIYTLMQAPQFIAYIFITVVFVVALMIRVKRSLVPTLQAPVVETAVESEEPSLTQPKNNTFDPFPSPVADNSAFMNSIRTPRNVAVDLKLSKRRRKDLKENSTETLETTLVIDPHLPLYWAAISGTVGAQSVLLAKCVMELIFESMRGENQFQYFGTYVLIVAMVLTLLSQTHTLNMACMHGDTMSSFPVFQAFWIGMSNVSGIVFFQQAHTFTATQWVMFPIALVFVMVGIYLIAKHEKMGNFIQYAVAMPSSLGSPRQHAIVAQLFQFTELTPQEMDIIASSSPQGIELQKIAKDGRLDMQDVDLESPSMSSNNRRTGSL